jgi:hypothetical protein
LRFLQVEPFSGDEGRGAEGNDEGIDGEEEEYVVEMEDTSDMQVSTVSSLIDFEPDF